MGNSEELGPVGKLFSEAVSVLELSKGGPTSSYQKEMSRKPQEWGKGVKVWLWVL